MKDGCGTCIFWDRENQMDGFAHCKSTKFNKDVNPKEEGNKYVAESFSCIHWKGMKNEGIEHNKITEILPSSAKQFIANNILSKPITKLKMTINERNMLINFYQKDVKKLEKLLDYKLLWPNFKD